MNQLKPLFWKKSNLFSKLLFPLSLLYKFFLFLKRSRTIEEKFDIPIICVGNIYLGGTGKTPLALKIYNELLKKNLKPGIIKKFYKEHLDEQNLIRSKNVKLFLNKSRKNSIIEAINKNINVVIMDDGFQDFSIRKNLNIICFNSEQLVGNGLLTLLSNIFTDLNLSDMETCYKTFRSEVIKNITIEENRFGFEPEITAKVSKKDYRIYEVGISYYGRTYREGKKIGWKDGFHAIWCILKYNLFR